MYHHSVFKARGGGVAMDQTWHSLYIYYLVYEEFDEIDAIFFIIFCEWSYMYENRHVWSIAGGTHVPYICIIY